MVILFQFVPVRGTNLFETLAIPNEIRKLIDKYARGETVPGAKRDTDIENYLTDIHRYGNEPPESGDATDLGKHTLNRHWQLKMAGRDTPNRESTDDFDTMQVDPQEQSDSNGYNADTEYNSLFDENGIHFVSPEDEYSELEFCADDLEDQPSAEAEDQNNFPLAALLSNTTMCCNEAKLDWSPIKTDIATVILEMCVEPCLRDLVSFRAWRIVCRYHLFLFVGVFMDLSQLSYSSLVETYSSVFWDQTRSLLF